MAAIAVKLRPVEVSPTTLQYSVPKYKPRPFYQVKFYPNDEAKKTLSQPWLAQTDPMMPPYPYGKNVPFEEANHGLYGGATIQSGNKIADGRNKGKTLRKWYPNVRVEKLRSDALNVEMSIPTTARVMRTIQKVGGLDNYVLGPKPARIKELGLLGWKLRWLVMNSDAVREKHEKQRRELKLPTTSAVDTSFEAAWADKDVRGEIVQKMHAGWEALGKKDQKFTKHVREGMNWEGRVPELRALKIHDPQLMKLPETIEVEETRFEMKEVPKGWGIQEVVQDKKPKLKVLNRGGYEGDGRAIIRGRLGSNKSVTLSQASTAEEVEAAKEDEVQDDGFESRVSIRFVPED